MDIYYCIDDRLRIRDPLAIALGTFDGIHMGHRMILEDTVLEAKRRGMCSACYCFSNIPKEYLMAKAGTPRRLRRLCTEDEKLEMMQRIGLDYVFSIPFDETTMSMPAATFVKEILVRNLNAKVISCGFNYTFGKGAEGDTALLKKIAAQYGIDVLVHDPVYVGGQLVSSTAIRALLEAGDEDLAHRLLGR